MARGKPQVTEKYFFFLHFKNKHFSAGERESTMVKSISCSQEDLGLIPQPPCGGSQLLVTPVS